MTPESLDRYSRGTSAGRALRTLRAGEVLDEALHTYRILAPALLRRSAVPAVFVLASVLFWTRAFLPRLFTTNSPGDVSAQVVEAAIILAVGLLVGGPLLVFGVSEATLQAVALVTPYLERRAVDEIGAASAARTAFPRTLGAGLWAFLVAGSVPAFGFGMMALGGLLAENNEAAGWVALFGVFALLLGLIFSLWAAGAYALIPAATLRGDSVRQACRRSRELMKGTARIPGGYGTVWGVYGVLFFAALAEWTGFALALNYVPFAAIAPGGGLFAEALSLAVPFVVAWTLLPFWGTAVAVIDIERRVRKEGYDVELLARS
ncbi:hypothetical protein EON82_03900 [bacterium]|nr:MAG: hypothetical protein EON82_03900 [bacterium]